MVHMLRYIHHGTMKTFSSASYMLKHTVINILVLLAVIHGLFEGDFMSLRAFYIELILKSLLLHMILSF